MQLLKSLQGIAAKHGATLTHVRSLSPLYIEMYAAHGDFSRGVLSAVEEVYAQILSTPDGRQAARDLGFDVGMLGVGGGDQ